MDKIGIETQTFDTDQIRKNLGAVGFAGGIRYLNDAETNPVQLLNLLLTKVNCDLHKSKPKHTAIERTSEGTRILKTDNGDFEAPMIVYTLNGYSPTQHPYFADKIFPTRGQILMMEKVPMFMDGPFLCKLLFGLFPTNA